MRQWRDYAPRAHGIIKHEATEEAQLQPCCPVAIVLSGPTTQVTFQHSVSVSELEFPLHPTAVRTVRPQDWYVDIWFEFWFQRLELKRQRNIGGGKTLLSVAWGQSVGLDLLYPLEEYTDAFFRSGFLGTKQ